MKRLMLVFLMVLMVALPVSAVQDWSRPSATKTASASIATSPGYFHGLVVMTDGTNAVTVDVYDNTAGSGEKLIPTWIVTSSATNRAQSYSINPPVRFYTGCYVTISIAGEGTASYMVYLGN